MATLNKLVQETTLSDGRKMLVWQTPDRRYRTFIHSSDSCVIADFWTNTLDEAVRLVNAWEQLRNLDPHD